MDSKLVTSTIAGGFYYDGESEVRQVIVTDQNSVTFRCVFSEQITYQGMIQVETIDDFSIWVKHKIPANHVIELLHSLSASKIDATLSTQQREFMRGFQADFAIMTLQRRPMHYLGIAIECEQLGVISIHTDENERADTFLVGITAIGSTLMKVL